MTLFILQFTVGMRDRVNCSLVSLVCNKLYINIPWSFIRFFLLWIYDIILFAHVENMSLCRLATIPPAVHSRYIDHRRGGGGGARRGSGSWRLETQQPQDACRHSHQHARSHHCATWTEQFLIAVNSTLLQYLMPFHLRPCSNRPTLILAAYTMVSYKYLIQGFSKTILKRCLSANDAQWFEAFYSKDIQTYLAYSNK